MQHSSAVHRARIKSLISLKVSISPAQPCISQLHSSNNQNNYSINFGYELGTRAEFLQYSEAGYEAGEVEKPAQMYADNNRTARLQTQTDSFPKLVGCMCLLTPASSSSPVRPGVRTGISCLSYEAHLYRHTCHKLSQVWDRLYLFRVRSCSFLSLFFLPSSCPTLHATSPVNSFHRSRKYGRVLSAVGVSNGTPSTGVFTNRGGGQLTSKEAKLSGFIQSQDEEGRKPQRVGQSAVFRVRLSTREVFTTSRGRDGGENCCKAGGPAVAWGCGRHCRGGP